MRAHRVTQRCGRCRKPGHIAPTCCALRPSPAEAICTCRTRRATSAVALQPCAWHRAYRAERRRASL
jgi:hypothetical protein